jgi:hypothetical protein
LPDRIRQDGYILHGRKNKSSILTLI